LVIRRNREVQIRRAVLSDARGISEVHVETWVSGYRGVVPEEYLKTLSVEAREAAFRSALTRGTPEMWVAQSESAITGWIAFGASRDADAGVATGELEAIYVAPKHWATGTGRALWLAAQARLVTRGFARVTLWVLEDNQRAIRFYRAAGFAADLGSRKQINVGGKPLWEIRYVRALS
jgi:ribosomal protein S18 acetylase RimI-like enzyme